MNPSSFWTVATVSSAELTTQAVSGTSEKASSNGTSALSPPTKSTMSAMVPTGSGASWAATTQGQASAITAVAIRVTLPNRERRTNNRSEFEGFKAVSMASLLFFCVVGKGLDAAVHLVPRLRRLPAQRTRLPERPYGHTTILDAALLCEEPAHRLGTAFR